MRLGIVGLGRIGGNLARAAAAHGHEVIGHDRDAERLEQLAGERLRPAASVQELLDRLPPPRVVFLYLPHGPVTEQVCEQLLGLLDPGDVLVDGGNSHWEDSRRRHAAFARTGIHFLDVGTSGGIPGAQHGACFMAGGEPEAYRLVEPLLRDLAVDDRATVLVGEAGSGHFAKLVHNAIEFGMVQAIAEGVELLQRSDLTPDLPALFDNWAHGSVIRSWLVELMRDALAEHPDLQELSTYVEDTGEVKWVLAWALERDLPSPVISESQQALMSYRDLDWPAAKAVALLRHAFGGHPVHTSTERLVRT
jgi:6-phosphogluconate dehydrogenase